MNEFEPRTAGSTDGAGGGEPPAFGTELLNHLGFVVDDAEALASRLRAAGFREGFAAPRISTAFASTSWMRMGMSGSLSNT